MTTSFRVIAIISAFNEGDIISFVIRHLVENGVDVYLLDNHSTDDTLEQAKPWLGRGLIEIEQFPAEGAGASAKFDWTAILRRKEELAATLQADWFMHHDADEVRESPWPGMSLQEGIRWVDRLGYDTIDFRVLNFPPFTEGFRAGDDPRVRFTEWEEPALPDTFQLKGWKATPAPLSLASSGGHIVSFPGQRIFPIKFLMRHYPIRSEDHGRRKVFEERKNRFLEGERAIGWHTQYDSIQNREHSFLPDPKQLHRFDPDHVRLELMLFNRAYAEAQENLERLQKDQSENANSADHELEERLAKLVAELGRLDSRITDLTIRLEEARNREASLVSRLEVAEKGFQSKTQVERDLRAEIDRLERHRQAVESSAGWRLLQNVRRLFGRAWASGRASGPDAVALPASESTDLTHMDVETALREVWPPVEPETGPGRSE